MPNPPTLDDQTRLLRDAAKLRERALTPEQAKRLHEVNARNEAMQQTAIKPPRTGTFGKGVPDPRST